MSFEGLFLSPWLWPALSLAPLYFLLMYAVDRKRSRRLRKTMGPGRKKAGSGLDPRKRLLRRVLNSTALFLALLAWMQPLVGEGVGRIEQGGVDIVVCLDVSRSMLAGDQSPNRLEYAKKEICALAERAKGDRLGLILFSGEARLVVPLTRDLHSFAKMVEQASTLSVRRGGTDLGGALERALSALVGVSGEHEAVVVLTDGEDHEERGLALARKYEKRGIRVHCIGLGSPRGSKITIKEKGGEAFLRDGSGVEVVSAMDPVGLGRIAGITGGEFVEAGTMSLPLIELYEERILPMARKSFEAEEPGQRENRYQWPLLLAFLLWILELCITDRKTC